MEEKKTEGLIGEGVKTLPIGQLLKRIGPGLIATGIGIGPGVVTTAAMLGANYGYALLWLIFPIIFMGITFVMTTNWLAITTGMPTIHAIRKYFGKVGATIVGIALFLACLFFTMGNISGTGAGMELLFGINWKIGSAIMIAIVTYTYFARNVYSKVEKLITACIIIMILAFYITLVGVGGPDGREACSASRSPRAASAPPWPSSPPTPPSPPASTTPTWARRRSGSATTCSTASCSPTPWST